MAIGSIIVQVYTSRAQIPIKNAYVSVSSVDGTNLKLLGFRVTNSSGSSGTIFIDTPNTNLSLSPSNVRPFINCIVKVSHPFYSTYVINNVQIFPNIQSLQSVELIPLAENSTSKNSTIQTTIPSQNL